MGTLKTKEYDNLIHSAGVTKKVVSYNVMIKYFI